MDDFISKEKFHAQPEAYKETREYQIDLICI